MKVNSKATKEFDIDKVICDIDVRYYVDCSFSKDNGETWEKDFEDDDESDNYVKSQLPCMKNVKFIKRSLLSGKEREEERQDWCPVIDVNEGKILDWTPGFCLYGDYLQITINGDGTIKDWDKLKKKLLNYVENYLDFDKVKSNVNVEDYIS